MAKEVYYRPPSEADSFIVRVMKGCPHNKCTFCNMFKDVACEALPVEEVIAGMEQDARELGPEHIGLVESMYLEGGDPLALKTENLLTIMGNAKRLFPKLTRFACYATARYTARKSQAELDALAEAGLTRVFVGLESGSDAILEATRKGCMTSDILNVGLKLARARIELDVSMMLGIGGVEYSSEHAEMTAHVINVIQPHCVRVRTFIPKKGTELGNAWLAGEFHLPGPHETLAELWHMVSRLTARTRLLSEHWTNYIHFDAPMPQAKEALLDFIEQQVARPETDFRKPEIDSVRS